MKQKEGTFSSEITEVLTYYRAVAQRTTAPRMKKPALRKSCVGAPTRGVPIKATASNTG